MAEIIKSTYLSKESTFLFPIPKNIGPKELERIIDQSEFGFDTDQVTTEKVQFAYVDEQNMRQGDSVTFKNAARFGGIVITRSEGRFENDQKEGPWNKRILNEDDKAASNKRSPVEAENFRHGKRHGAHTLVQEKSKGEMVTLYEANYTDGVLDGKFSAPNGTNPDGSLIGYGEGSKPYTSLEGTYKDGVKHGQWTLATEGQMVRATYVDNVLEGPYEKEHASSIEKGLYKNGKKDGEWIFENKAKPNVLHKATYKDGVKHGPCEGNDIFPDRGSGSGHEISKGQFVNDEKDGFWHKKGIQDGVDYETKETFVKGVLEGPYEHIGRDGEIKKGDYARGYKQGKWHEVNAAGDVAENIYHEGERISCVAKKADGGSYELKTSRAGRTEKRTDYAGNVTIQERFRDGSSTYEDIGADGSYKKGSFQDNYKIGEWIERDESGVIKKLNYKNEGLRYSYEEQGPDGHFIEGTYNENKKDGLWLTLSKDGKTSLTVYDEDRIDDSATNKARKELAQLKFSDTVKGILGNARTPQEVARAQYAAVQNKLMKPVV